MSFTCVGVGPGDSELLTVKAVRLIEEADTIVVPVKKKDGKHSTALTIAKPYIKDMDKVMYLYFPMVHIRDDDEVVQGIFSENGQKINKELEQGKKVVYLTLGDPSVYCTFAYIKQYIEEVTYVPGIASFLQGAAQIGEDLCLGQESLAIINMTDDEETITRAMELHDNLVVMKVSANPSLLHQLIVKGKRSVTFLSNMGLEEESVTRDLAFLEGKVPYFTVAQIKR